MRYLKIKKCDGIYDFIPLETITFGFIEVDEHEYKIELRQGNHTIKTYEKQRINDIEKEMRRIAELPEYTIIFEDEL